MASPRDGPAWREVRPHRSLTTKILFLGRTFPARNGHFPIMAYFADPVILRRIFPEAGFFGHPKKCGIRAEQGQNSF